MPCQQHAEIIELWLASQRLPTYHFGSCQRNCGFQWRSCQRAANRTLVAVVAQLVSQWLGNHRAANEVVAANDSLTPVTFESRIGIQSILQLSWLLRECGYIGPLHSNILVVCQRQTFHTYHTDRRSSGHLRKYQFGSSPLQSRHISP